MDSVIKDIEAFCARHGITERQFGVAAVNDTSLMFGLRGRCGRKPRRLRMDTFIKIKSYMERVDAETAAAAAAAAQGCSAGEAAE